MRLYTKQPINLSTHSATEWIPYSLVSHGQFFQPILDVQHGKFLLYRQKKGEEEIFVFALKEVIFAWNNPTVQGYLLVNELDKLLNANVVTEEVTHHLHQWAVDLDCLFKELAQLATATDYTSI